jgi:hypothetical protein
MNEQALQDSYNLFVQQGYNKSIDDFKQLIATNPEALNDSYALFQEEGYNKSIDDYKNLMGVGAQPTLKKKEPTTTASSLADTSSDLSSEQKFNPFAQNTVGIPQPKPTKSLVAQETIQPMAEATSVPAIDVTEKAPTVPAIDIETQKLINDENNISTIAEDDGWYSDNLKMVSFLADKIQYLNPTAAAVFPATTKGAVKFLDNTFRAIDQGQRQGSIIAPATTMEALGKNTSSETIQKYIRATKDVERFGPSKDMQAFSKTYQDEGESTFGVIKGLVENPQVLPELVISSMSTMANLPTVAAGASVVGGAALAGGIPTAGVGAIPAALASIPYAMGTMSAVLENGLTFGELLQEELTKRNLPFTEEGVRKVLEDEKALSSMRIKAASRGAIIGVIDGLTARVAGKVGAKLLGNTTASKIKAGATAVGIQMGGGSGGEAAARAAIGQKMDKAEIILEGISEGPMAIPSLYAEVLKKPTFKINGEAVTEQTVKDIVENGSGAELATIKFEIKNDNVGYNKIIQDKVVTNSIKEDVRKANPNLNETSLNAITELEKQLQDLEGNKTQTGKDKSAALRQEIKDIQENQLQEEVKAEVVTEEKPKEFIYYERDGKYFKKLGQDGEEKPITKTTYNFETKKQAELAALETTKTKEDAIQEPSTDESLLRSEQPEVGLQEVGKGNAQPEGPTTGTAEVVNAQPQEEVAPELTEQQREIQRNKLDEEVFRAKKNIARAEDTEAAIEEYNAAKKTLADFDAAEEQRKDKNRAKTNVATIIEDEAVTAQRAGYEYKDLYEQDPRLAAIQGAKDMVQFAESGDLATAYVEQGLSKKEAKAKAKNSVKTSQQDILDLETDIQENPIVSSKTLEVAPAVETTAAPAVETTAAPAVEETVAPAEEEEIIYSSDGKLYEEYSKKKINEAFDNMPFKKFISLFRKHINPNFTRENNLKSNGGVVTKNFSFQEHAGYVIGDGSYGVTEDQFRAFAKDAGIEIPAAPVVEETVAPAVEETAAPVVEETAAFVVEEEQYIPITEKQVSHEKFTKDNAQDVEYDYKTGENGREYEYISKISVELINDDSGESIGNLVKNIDEEGNVTWNGEELYGEELSEDGFDTKAEAIKGLVDKYNETQKSEFDEEAKRQAKAADKEAVKVLVENGMLVRDAIRKVAAKKTKTAPTVAPTAVETTAAPAVAPTEDEGPTTEDLSPIDSMLDLDLEDDDNMARVLRALEKADKALTKRSRTNANDALLGIPLTTIQIVIKGVKILVKGGMLLRDAIKKVAAENNLSEQKVVDILNTKSLDITEKGKSEMPMSADNVLYDDSEVLPKPDKKVKNSAVAKLLQSVAANFWGGSIVTSNSITPEQEDVITNNGIREAIEAFEASGKNAADWYSKAIETAIAVAGVVHPELSSKEAASKIAAFAKEKDPSRAAQMALRMALAITSQNLNVDANTIYAEEQFEYFKKNGKFDPSREYGAKAPAISSNLRLANLLIETLGLNEAENFISKEFTVKDLEDAFKKATGKQLTIAGLRNDNVNGAAIFGPKIGQGFLQNLMGKFDPVTIDLWMRRTWGRWTGDVVGTGITDERFAKLILSVKQAIKNKELDIQLPKEFFEYKPIQEKRKGKNGKSFWTMNKKFVNRIENDLDFVNIINNITKEISAKANTLYKIIHDIPMSKELYAKFISGELSYVQVANKLTAINERLKEQYKKYAAAQKAKGLTPLSLNDKKDDKNNTIKGWLSIQNEKDGRIYNPTNEEISERKPQWGNEAKNIVDDLNPIDVPTNLDRRVITRVVNNIRKGMNKQNYTVTNADVQALLWYPEKDIWAKLRGEKESNLKLSYDDQFIKLAEKRGLGEQANKVAEGIRGRGPESNIPTSKRGGDESVPSRTNEGGVGSIDEVLDLDVKDNDNLKSVLNFLDSVDKGLSKRLFGSANDALLAIPLTTIKAVVKSLKLLVKGGMLLRDAIRKVSAENNISQDSVRDILNIAPIQDGFTKLMGEVEAMVRRQTSRGSTQARMTTNVDTLVRNSEVYQNANDAQKKIMEREARGVMGVSPRRAPSIGRILGQLKDITNVSREDKLKIINQIMQLAKDASKDLATEIKGLKTQGKITVNQAANIISRLGKVNMLNETSVSKFVDYMSNVFADAEYADKISNIRKKLKTARVNVKTKLGAAKNLIPVMEKLFAINPEIIPTDMFEDYSSLVEMMGKRQEVLDLKDIKTLTDMTNSILDKVNEEQSQVQELSDRFEWYGNPVLDDNGNIKYADTISAMVKDGTITEQEAELMRKYKNDISPRPVKEKMTEKEIADEKQALIKELNSMTIDPSKMASVDDRAKASTLKDLLKSKAINKLNAQQLKNLIKVVSAINNGILPHSAQLAIERLNAINNATSLVQAIFEGVPLSFSKLYSNFKSLFTGKDAIQEMVRRNPLYFIDQLFGNFKTKRIFNALFEAAAKAQSLFESNMNKVNRQLEEINSAVAKSFGLNPNKTLMSSYKMMAYMIQQEYLSNPDSKQVNPAHKFLEATIKQLDNDGRNREADMLQEILDKYTTDGSIDVDKMYASFNPTEKSALKSIREINDGLTEKAVHTAGVIRGQRINPLNNYIHLSVINELDAESTTSVTAAVDAYNRALTPSTKGKSLIERTGSVNPLNFDVFASVQQGAKSVLMDYYLTEPIRTARKTLAETEKMMAEQGRLPKEKREIFSAIKKAFNEATENFLVNNYIANSFSDEVVNYLTKQGYRAILASAPRFVGELTSNVGYALVTDRNSFMEGIKYKDILSTPKAVDIVNNVKSKQIGRLFHGDSLGGRFIDTSILSQKSGTKGGKLKSTARNTAETIYNRSLKKYKNAVEFTADALISTPDKMVMRPIWFGSFANEFQNITGTKVDFDKIASNDESYMNKYKEAINSATTYADNKSVLAGATDNAYMGILKGTSKPNQSALLKAFNNFNNFMTRFAIYEYTTARTGVYAMVGNGSISKKQGAALLAGVTTRMVVYTMLVQSLGALLLSMLSDEPPEEDEKSFIQKFGQSLTSTVLGLFVGRDFGNATKTILNYGIEGMNEKFLTALREGEYDPYKDAIAYSIIPKEKKGQKTNLSDYLTVMGGSMGPALKTLDLAIRKATENPKQQPNAIKRQQAEIESRLPLEILGNLGYIPLYKDVRKVVISNIYSSLKEEKKSNEIKQEEKQSEQQEKVNALKTIIEESNDEAVIKQAKEKIDKLDGSTEQKNEIKQENAKDKKAKEKLLVDPDTGEEYDNESDLKRYNRNLWEQNFGEGSAWYESHKEEKEAESLLNKKLQEIKDREMNYTGRNSDGSVKRFGASDAKKTQRFGSGSKGKVRRFGS